MWPLALVTIAITLLPQDLVLSQEFANNINNICPEIRPGQDDLPGFDMIRNFRLDDVELGFEGVTEVEGSNKMQRAYRLSPKRTNLTLPTRTIFPLGLPGQFSFVATFRKRNLQKRSWNLIRIDDLLGKPQFGITFYPKTNEMDFYFLDFQGRLQTATFTDVECCFLGICQFAELHACTNLKLEAKRYIERNFIEVIQEDEFCELPKDALKSFLRSEGLNIDSEFQVFQATMKWILHDVTHRQKYVSELLEAVRLPVISIKQLDSYAQECPDLNLKVSLLKSLQNHRIEMRLVEAKRRLGQVYDVRLQPRMCAKKCVYVLGGYNRELGRRWNESTTLVTVERLETLKCQWKTLSPMLHSRSGHGVAVLNNLIYVIGGESDCLIFSNGEVYDPVSNQWSMICSMNLPRCALGTCALNGYLYALGGWVGAEIGDTMEQYDPLVNKWTIIGKMSIPRYAMGVVAYQGLIYIIGGLSALSTELDLVESFNPVTGEWNRLAPLSTRCAYVGVAVLHDQIYTVGGTNNSHAALRTVERYSIEENKWTEVTSVKTARAGASVISVNGRLLVIGGRTSSDEFSAPVTLNTVEVYDPETNSWTESTHMPTSRCEAGVAVL
ncbi:uncharacterized protein LOC143241731 [Tachypleus tridentatus]|uniref:uncharacterized protein LOC143241731 n=1 Tax=Tachypleus tridentatus TaxID=6853 RepID=UPI003FCEE996